MWILIAHWVACLWWFIGKQEYENAELRELNGESPRNETTWLLRIPPAGITPGLTAAAFAACVESCLATCTSNLNPWVSQCTRVSCQANSTCDANNLNPYLSYEQPGEVTPPPSPHAPTPNPNHLPQVWNQWLTSVYPF